jgi:uncharacterized membrane protein YwzB
MKIIVAICFFRIFLFVNIFVLRKNKNKKTTKKNKNQQTKLLLLMIGIIGYSLGSTKKVCK